MPKLTKDEFAKKIKAYAKRFDAVRDAARPYCVGQDDLLNMASLAVVAKQHALLVGPWGCNKTRTINVFTHLIGATNGQMFRCTLDKTTPPEALLGPISPKVLLEEDRFKRNLTGTICDATFAFVGEAFSGNSATRRALHTVLNERYVENGGEKVPVCLHTAFLDSNDLPSRREDRPFYDRIVLRTEVAYLDPADKDSFLAMRRSPVFTPGKLQPILSLQEVREAASLARLIIVPPVIDDAMHMLRSDLYAQNVQLSDRRWHHAYSVLRAAALLDGRVHVSPGDLWALRFVLADLVDGLTKTIVDRLRPYKGQSLRDAEQTFVKDANDLYTQAMQGNTTFREHALESVRGLAGNVIDADAKAEIDAIALKLEEAIATMAAVPALPDASNDDGLTDEVLDDLMGLGPDGARDASASDDDDGDLDDDSV